MKGYSYTVVDNNMAKSKGVGYYLSRLSVAISIVILTISLPLTVYSGFLTLGGSGIGVVCCSTCFRCHADHICCTP